MKNLQKVKKLKNINIDLNKKKHIKSGENTCFSLTKISNYFTKADILILEKMLDFFHELLWNCRDLNLKECYKKELASFLKNKIISKKDFKNKHIKEEFDAEHSYNVFFMTITPLEMNLYIKYIELYKKQLKTIKKQKFMEVYPILIKLFSPIENKNMDISLDIIFSHTHYYFYKVIQNEEETECYIKILKEEYIGQIEKIINDMLMVLSKITGNITGEF